MQGILNDINAVEGVVSSLVYSDEGEMFAQVMSGGADQKAPPPSVGEAVASIIAAAKANSQTKMGDIDLMYDGGRLVLKPLGTEGCLCVVCVPQINVSLLNLTANLATRKLEQMVRERKSIGLGLEIPAEQPEREIERAPTEPMTRAEMMAATSRRS